LNIHWAHLVNRGLNVYQTAHNHRSQYQQTRPPFGLWPRGGRGARGGLGRGARGSNGAWGAFVVGTLDLFAPRPARSSDRDQIDPNFGPAYRKTQDSQRIGTQLSRIRSLMLDGAWRTLFEIEDATGDPSASISAQLRHLRKPRFGGFTVERRRRSTGTWEYRVSPPGSQ